MSQPSDSQLRNSPLHHRVLLVLQQVDHKCQEPQLRGEEVNHCNGVGLIREGRFNAADAGSGGI